MVDGHWKVHKQGAPADPGRPWMSNGFAGITFALHMCARVDVYGRGFTLVPISAQLELPLAVSAQIKFTLAPSQPKLTRGCVAEVLRLSSNGAMCPEGLQVEL
jgi:hypothetical protein